MADCDYLLEKAKYVSMQHLIGYYDLREFEDKPRE